MSSRWSTVPVLSFPMGIGTAVPDDWVVLPKPDVDHYALYKHIKSNPGSIYRKQLVTRSWKQSHFYRKDCFFKSVFLFHIDRAKSADKNENRPEDCLTRQT